MDLVNELQISAERDDVLTVLRKARRLASKLGVSSIDHWLESEQNGYSQTDKLPNYRVLLGTLVYRTNGPIPYGFGYNVNGILPISEDKPIRQCIWESIAEVTETVSRCGDSSLYVTAREQATLRRMFDHHIADQFTFMIRISKCQYTAIPERVKDTVLDWACQLERNGIVGKDMSFNPEERSKAESITFNISGSSIGQLNNMGTNSIGELV